MNELNSAVEEMKTDQPDLISSFALNSEIGPQATRDAELANHGLENIRNKTLDQLSAPEFAQSLVSEQGPNLLSYLETRAAKMPAQPEDTYHNAVIGFNYNLEGLHQKAVLKYGGRNPSPDEVRAEYQNVSQTELMEPLTQFLGKSPGMTSRINDVRRFLPLSSQGLKSLVRRSLETQSARFAANLERIGAPKIEIQFDVTMNQMLEGLYDPFQGPRGYSSKAAKILDSYMKSLIGIVSDTKTAELPTKISIRYADKGEEGRIETTSDASNAEFNKTVAVPKFYKEEVLPLTREEAQRRATYVASNVVALLIFGKATPRVIDPNVYEFSLYDLIENPRTQDFTVNKGLLGVLMSGAIGLQKWAQTSFQPEWTMKNNEFARSILQNILLDVNNRADLGYVSQTVKQEIGVDIGPELNKLVKDFAAEDVADRSSTGLVSSGLDRKATGKILLALEKTVQKVVNNNENLMRNLAQAMLKTDAHGQPVLKTLEGTEIKNIVQAYSQAHPFWKKWLMAASNRFDLKWMSSVVYAPRHMVGEGQYQWDNYTLFKAKDGFALRLWKKITGN